MGTLLHRRVLHDAGPGLAAHRRDPRSRHGKTAVDRGGVPLRSPVVRAIGNSHDVRAAGPAQYRVVDGLYRDRTDAGRQLAAALDPAGFADAVVIGLARGGVPVAAEVARVLSLPLDALAVRKIGHPWQPEYGLGAAAPGGDGIFVRNSDGLDEHELGRVIAEAKTNADLLDRVLHERQPPLDPHGRTAVLVDDGLATGATMVAAVRWARSHGATRVVVAVPIGAWQSAQFLRHEADELVCLHEPEAFGAVGFWYEQFPQVEDAEVLALLDEHRSRLAA
jgi:putative phosphoribosyl transferase